MTFLKPPQPIITLFELRTSGDKPEPFCSSGRTVVASVLALIRFA
jgi:hypothetical protein